MLRATLLLTLFFPTALRASAQEAPQPTITVRQSGEGQWIGNDDEVLQNALNQLAKNGGTLVIGAGRYPVRRSLFLPKNVVVRGEEGAVLALPSPVVTRDAAAAGSREVVLAEPGEFVGKSRVQILPPVGSEFFADGKTKTLELQQVERVEKGTLFLIDPPVSYTHLTLPTNREV